MNTSDSTPIQSFLNPPSPAQVKDTNSRSQNRSQLNQHISTMTTAYTTRSRAYSITLQLLQHEQQGLIPKLQADLSSYPARYSRLLIGGPEQAPTATEGSGRHVHCYVEFTNQRTVHQVIKLMHLDNLKHWFTNASVREYSFIRSHHLKLQTKIDPLVRVLIEYPDPPRTTGITRDITETDDYAQTTAKRVSKPTMEGMRQIIEAGGTIEDMKDYSYGMYIKNKSAFEAEHNKYRAKPQAKKRTHIWIHGSPQTGKTASVMGLYPDAYVKDMGTATWDGYNNEDTVVLNDIDNQSLRHMTVQKLKTLCDPMGTKCNVKYGMTEVRATIIVTSNYSIKDCFQYKGKNAKWQEEVDETDVDYQAIKARFKQYTIKKWLMHNDLQLKPKQQRDTATSCMDVFEKYDPEHKVDEYSERDAPSRRTFDSESTTDHSTTSTVDDGPGEHTELAPDPDERTEKLINKQRKKIDGEWWYETTTAVPHEDGSVQCQIRMEKCEVVSIK